ncbi:MAG: hypothetical protein ACYTAN_16760, partial [Planctomycetota bacterium]
SYNRYIEYLAPLLVTAKTSAATRFCRSLAESGEITFVETEDETTAALCRVVKYCRRIRNPLEAALLGCAAADLCRCPTADALPALAEAKRLVDKLENQSDWRDTLEDVPVMGRLFGWGESQDWRTVNVVEDALWACENLAGKSEAEMLAAYETTFFGGKRPNIDIRLFVERYPEEFTALVLKHWDSLLANNRYSYFWRAYDSGGGGAIAERLADSEDVSQRVVWNCALYEATGDRKYLTVSLEALHPPVDLAALNSEEGYDLQTASSQLAELYKEDASLEDVRERLISLWQSLSGAGLQWHEMEDFGFREVCKGLISAGGRKNIEVAMEMIRKKDETDEWPLPRWFFRTLDFDLWCAHDLLQSHDPLVADALLEYVRGELPELKRYGWLALSRVLALKGDERLAALFNEAMPRAAKRQAQTPDFYRWQDVRDYSTSQILRGLIALVECINADDPVAFLVDLFDEERELVTNLGGTDLLADYAEEEILALMAEDRCEPILPLLYTTLLARRADGAAD